MPKTISLSSKQLLSLISQVKNVSAFQNIKQDLKKILHGGKMLDRVFKRKMVVVMKKKNVSNKLIHEVTGVPIKSINRMYKMWKDGETFFDAGRSGRPSKLDEDQKKELQKFLNEQREASSPTIKKLWEKTAPLPIGVSQIQKIRKKLGYRYKLAKQKPILRQENVSKRLSFARKHLKQHWTNHVFIDEADFQLYPNKKRMFIRPKENVFFHRPRHSPAVKVIAGVSIYGQVFFRTYSRNIDSSKFKKIMGKVKTLVKKEFPNPIVVMDNAPSHKSKLSCKWLQKHFRTLQIPPQSPELNPIETIFALLKKKIEDKKPENLKKLNSLIKSCWKTFDKVWIKRTIQHTNKICKQIIKSHGSNKFK